MTTVSYVLAAITTCLIIGETQALISFSSNTISPFIQDTYDDFDWSAADSVTSSADTGPSSGHTCTYCSTDDYAFIETSSRTSGDKAIMYLPTTYTGGCVDVSLWYHGYGTQLGSLKIVYTYSTSYPFNWQYSTWQASTISRNYWQQGSVRINADYIQIGIEGTVGSGYRGDYAVDDISVTSCSTPGTFTTPPTGYQATPTITFVGGSISPLIRDGYSQFDWSTRSTSTPSSGTGPSKGHTCSSCTSDYYAYIESSSPNDDGDKAVMYLPVQFTSGCVDVSFWYHGYGTSLGSLKIVSTTSNSAPYLWQEQWQASSLSYNSWQQASVKIYSSNVMVGIEGTVGSSYKGDYAVDDVWINACGTATPSAQAPTSTTKGAHTTKIGNTTTYTNYTGGEIRSPGYPSDYKNNLNVRWIIKVDPQMTIVLKIKEFETSYEDELKVYDHTVMNRGLLKTYSGYESESVYSTSVYQIELHFESNSRKQSKGFLLEWYLLDFYGNEVAQTNNVPTEGGSTFSTGGIIGVAVGVSVGFVFVFIACRRHHQKKTNAARCNNTATQNGATNQRTGYLNQSYASATPMQPYPTQPQSQPWTTAAGQPQAQNQMRVPGYTQVPGQGNLNPNPAYGQSTPSSGYTYSQTGQPPPPYGNLTYPQAGPPASISSDNGYTYQPPPLPQGYHNPASPQQRYEQNPPPQDNVNTTPAPFNDKVIPTAPPPNSVPQSVNTYGSQQFHSAHSTSQSSAQGLPPVDLPPPPSYDSIDMYSVGPTPNAATYKPPGANE